MKDIMQDIMKNIKFLLVCLLAVFIFGGCGGGNSGDISSEPEQNNTQEDTALDTTITRIANNLFSLDENGVPAVFNYAPVPDSYGDGGYGASNESVNFSRIITNNDLDENYEFVQTIGLQKDCGYIIKYSHSGRDLNFSALSLRITTPDKRNMILSFSPNRRMTDNDIAKETYPITVRSINDLSESEINRVLSESGMTREELASEIASDNSSTLNASNVIYVDATLEVIPEENPCAVLYTFKAPETGSYTFAFGETNSGGLPEALDVPVEIRVYTADESYSAGDDESFDLSPRDIINVQRMLINSATEFNEYGLPVKWDNESPDTEGASVKSSFVMRPQGFKPFISIVLDHNFSNIIEPDTIDYDMDRPVNLKDRIDDIPYDDVYDPCAGFYALTGLRSIINSALRDDDYSESAIVFDENTDNVHTPANGKSLGVTEKFNVNIIGTQEEHDRAVGMNDMTNFALIGYASGTYGNNDPIDLGVVNTKNVHLRYELVENDIRLCRDSFSFKSAALNMLKNNREAFQREFGDYFVCGYTWGLFYDALIEIRANSDEGFAVIACSLAADDVKAMLNYANNTRNRSEVTRQLNQINNRYSSYVTITIKASYSGRSSGTVSLTLSECVNDVMNFIDRAKSRPRSDYHKLYVSLMNYYNVDPASRYMSKEAYFENGTYNNIRALTKKIYHTRCYYNALSTIPDSHLLSRGEDFTDDFGTRRDGLKTKLREFDSLLSGMMYSLNAICKDRSRLRGYFDSFDILYKWYKNYAERYSFYRYFVAVQKKTSTNGWSDSDEDHNV